jgi:hypothetical protein
MTHRGREGFKIVTSIFKLSLKEQENKSKPAINKISLRPHLAISIFEDFDYP